MPAYNAQNYLDECIQSIILQSFTQWELIIIDDGSTDKTPQICDMYSKSEERITVLHKGNAGVSVARNIGIEHAKGKYIAFVDADDILSIDSLKLRVNTIKNSEMAIAAYETFDKSGSIIDKMPECKCFKWNKKQALRNILVSGEIGYQGYLWNKLFKRTIIIENNLKFVPEIAYNEDRLFCISYLMHCSNVNLSNEIVYKYRLNENGAMASLELMTDRDYNKIMSEFNAYDYMCALMATYNKDLYHICALDAQQRACDLYKQVVDSEIELKRGMRNCIRSYGIKVIGARFRIISAKQQIKVLAHMILKR